MARLSSAVVAFNRGIISVLGLARVDIDRLRMAAETQTNWMSRVLGSMMLRPGWKYVTSSRNDARARGIPFVFDATDQAHIELTDSSMRVLVDDELVTRPQVTAAVVNDAFSSDLSNWVDNDESGAISSWATGGYMGLLGDGTNDAIRRQQVAVNEADTLHALRIIVERGPVILKVGSSGGEDDYIATTTLLKGEHSLSFTPSGNFHIELSSSLKYTVLVDSVSVEALGVMEIPAPWPEASLRNLRYSASGDVIFVAANGYRQYRIERRAVESWSIVEYESTTGPFRIQNVSEITIAPSGLSGDITLTASKPIFKPGHVGALFRVASTGQTVTRAISSEDAFSDPIRVNGVGTSRTFGFVIAGTWSGTVTIQYSVSEPGNWIDLDAQYTGNISSSYDDGQDNQVIYYRIGLKAGDYTSGTVNVSLNFASGSLDGIARVEGFTSETVVDAVVLQDFGDTQASSTWWEGDWSDYRGWPTASALYEGRKWWLGRDKIWGSISDAFADFDDTFEGDAAPISRSIGEGPVDSIHWALPLGRLAIGTALNSANVQPGVIDGDNVLLARSTSFDEPLTPTNFNLKNASRRGVYVDRSEQRLFEIGYDLETNDYQSRELSLLVPDLNESGIVHVAVQMKPDVRIHCVRNDGTVGVMIYDRVENVLCWVDVETSGEVEDCLIFPNAGEDRVYYLVKRTIDGETKRFWERWATETNCTGRPVGHLADSHVLYSGAESTVISGLSHLEGESVVVWGWNTQTPFTDKDGDAIGRDLGPKTVRNGSITIDAAVTDACVGLGYSADFKGMKLVELTRKKKINEYGLSLINTHYQGLRVGRSFSKLYDLSKSARVGKTPDHQVWADLDTDMDAFGGRWEEDARLCMRAAAPRPCTVRAVTMGYEG